MPTREGIYYGFVPKQVPPGKMRIYRDTDRYEPTGLGHAILMPVWQWACAADHGRDPIARPLIEQLDGRDPLRTWDEAMASARRHAELRHGVRL